MPTPRTDTILEDLTEPQRRAVTYGEGPLLVVAGAGSGKTRVITRRIAHLINEGTEAERIVAITFTNKAADEMRRRVEALAGRGTTVRTFHSLCAWLLRREGQEMGLEAGFSIYDRADSRRVVRQVCKEMELDKETYRPAELLDRISAAKDRVEDPQQVAEDAVGLYDQTAAEVYARYNNRLRENNALDFDDLLVRTIELFSRCPGVLRKYQESYLHVLVDEYQDTNLPQHLIARALQGKHRNITAVGDPDQMIYTWRGARLENIMEFEEDFPGAQIIKLERNYRSSGNILRAASACIRHNELRREKNLWTERDPGKPVHVKEFEDSYEEADWVAEQVQTHIDEGISPSEIAVLYRTKYQSLQLEEALATSSVPFQVVDTVGFFDRRQVKDLRAYMRLIINPRDDEAFLRIVNVPTRGIGARTVEQIEALARAGGQSLCHAVRSEENLERLGTRARRAVEGFRALYERLCGLECETIYSLLKKILSETDYMDAAREDERQDAREVIDYLLGYARQYDRRHPGGDLIDFMERTALISDVDGWKAEAEAASLMTLHSAKGLEFDVVFIIGLDEGILPHRRSLDEDEGANERQALEEERRLLHVGMTRARHKLHLTHAGSRMIRGRDQFVAPSRFLDELPHEGVRRETLDTGADAALAFAADVRRVSKRKKQKKSVRASGRSKGVLEVVEGDGQSTITTGARVRHKSYGEGTVVSVDSAGKHHMIRVDFPDHGVLTLLVPAG